ncbi:MAG: CBS domain-containing protein [Desulfobacteraceae bacterium]|nr:MAG: CBS domain-containing protein [Desulfobacteraceae bacterium]
MEIIVTHKNTDFDALASVFAAALLYPPAKPVLPRAVNPNIKAFLSIHKNCFVYHDQSDTPAEKINRLVVVDTAKWSRLENGEQLKARADLDIILWDHHPEAREIKTPWTYHQIVGATVTLLVKNLQEEKRKLSPMEATLFIAGIYEDTGNLTFPSTTALDLKAAGFLLEQGADLTMAQSFLRPAYGPKQKDVLFEMLKNENRINLQGFEVSFNRVEVTGHTPGLALVVDMFLDIMNVDAAFGIFYEPGKNNCITIGRGGSNTLNIGAIMKKMGGGGHPSAGSAMLKSIEPGAVEEWVKELILNHQKPSVCIGDLMTAPVVSIAPESPMKEVALIFRQQGYTGLPVVAGNQLIGIISRQDFKKMKKPDLLHLPVKAFMSTKVITISPESSVTEATRLMVKHDIGRLPVIKDGILIGILTRSDAMRHYYDLLPA